MISRKDALIVTARQTVIFAACLALVGLIGCGGSSETTQEEGAASADTTTAVVDTTAAMPQADTTHAAEIAQAMPAQPGAQGPSKMEMMQQEMDALKTENVQLKEKLSASVQTNKDLTAKISDLEAAQIAAQEKASKPTGEKMAMKTATKPAAGKTSSEDIDAYNEAVSMARQHKYKDAIEEFQALIDEGIKADYADNCHYWMGECYFGMRDYKTAVEHFKEVFKFKISEKKDDAQFMVAQCYERLGNRTQAQAEYKKFVEQYPNSEYMKRAQAKVGK